MNSMPSLARRSIVGIALRAMRNASDPVYGLSKCDTYSTNEHWFITTGTSIYGNMGETHWSSARQPLLHSSTEMIRLTNMMLIKEESMITMDILVLGSIILQKISLISDRGMDA